MSGRVAPRIDPEWDWSEHDHPVPGDQRPPDLTTDDDRDIVGTILDAKGKPLHTVRRRGAVEFGYRAQSLTT